MAFVRNFVGFSIDNWSKKYAISDYFFFSFLCLNLEILQVTVQMGWAFFFVYWPIDILDDVSLGYINEKWAFHSNLLWSHLSCFIQHSYFPLRTTCLSRCGLIFFKYYSFYYYLINIGNIAFPSWNFFPKLQSTPLTAFTEGPQTQTQTWSWFA